jgi:hypothetical protein
MNAEWLLTEPEVEPLSTAITRQRNTVAVARVVVIYVRETSLRV